VGPAGAAGSSPCEGAAGCAEAGGAGAGGDTGGVAGAGAGGVAGAGAGGGAGAGAGAGASGGAGAGGAFVCQASTSSNYDHTVAGRAVRCGDNGSYTCALGSGINLGLWNTFETNTLHESSPGYFELGPCP
jgi:hypothetical protein